jgi:hypothetical protein
MTKEPGLSLADLAAMTLDVPVGQSHVTVSGISARDALAIFKRFPKLASLMEGFNLTTFLEVAPDAAAAVIAAGFGKLGSEEDEAAAAKIGVETQFDILEAIGGLTFKNGFAPFVGKITRLANAAGSANSTKVPAMTSPTASKPSSQPDTPQT